MAEQGYNRRESYGSGQVMQGAPIGSFTIEGSGFARSNYGKRKNKRPPKRHTGVKAFLLLLLVAILAAVGVVGYYGNQFYQSAQNVRVQASEAMNDLSAIKADIVAGDMEGAQKAAASLSQKAQEMNEETDGDLWVLAEKIPIYGEDVATVRTLTDVLEDVSVNALEPLCDQLSGFSLKSLIGEDESMNVDQISALVNELATISPVLERSAEAFNKCPEPHLNQLTDVINKASSELNSTNELFVFANHFAPLISDVFGANGTRNYLIVAQNNVEARATGGFYGQVGMMTIDNGHIEMGDFSGMSDSSYNNAFVDNHMSDYYEPISIIGFPDPHLQDMGTNPDVPHVASVLYDACVAAGNPVDGVIIVDPIFIQKLVALTGEFTLSDGTVLNGDNFATVIMHDTYWRFVNDNRSQDAFFAMAADDAMHSFLSSLGNADIKELAETVLDNAKTRHLSIWLADADEQAAVAELGCSGAVSSDPTSPVAGIYFTNESWSKMEWYLHADKEITSVSDNADGSKTYGITLTLTNTISDYEAYAGNWYVTGDAVRRGNSKIMYQPADMLERVVLCAPAGGSIADIWTDADVYDSATGEIYGLQASRHNIHLLPGQTVTFTYNVTTSSEALKDLEFDMTPLAQDAM